MSAEILRRAAALMRERAVAAEHIASATGAPIAWHSEGALELDFDPDDAGHIAGMSPVVALAVADLLDVAATHQVGFTPAARERIVNVAHAYLGELDA